jgi:lauroyl/myristoyl acyltransferase
LIIRDSLLRDFCKLVAWYPMRWLVTALPWSFAYALGNIIGIVDGLLGKHRVRQMETNILRGLGTDGVDANRARTIAHMVVRRHYVEHMEFYKFATLTAGNLNQRISFEGLERLQAMLAHGKGVILVHMHFGSKQFPMVALGLNGFPVTQVGYRDPEAGDHSWIHRNVHLKIRMRIESSFSVKYLHLGNSFRSGYDALKANQILMITGDGIGGIRGAQPNYLPVPFLGQTMMVPPGPARIALKTGAALIPLFCVQSDDGWTYRAVFEEPVLQQNTGNRDTDVKVNTGRFVAVFERYVRQYPDHWMFWEEFQPGNLLNG